MTWRAALIGVVLLQVATAHAEPEEAHAYNPGQLGPNALPPQPGEPAWIPLTPQLTVAVAMQRTQSVLGADDASLTIPFRVEVPFAGRASLIVEGQPFEWWLASDATRSVWQPSSWNGLSQADIRIGGKFLVFNGAGRWPSVAIRALTKTTTGKSFFDHRFINAPAYLFDALFSHRFTLPALWFVDLWLNVGFFAWQQGPYGQNDAESFSATVRAGRPELTVLLEGRGYFGWQKWDKPVQLQLSIDVPLGSITGFISATAGLRDPAFFDVRVGIRLGEALRPTRRGDLDEGSPRAIHGFKSVFFTSDAD